MTEATSRALVIVLLAIASGTVSGQSSAQSPPQTQSPSPPPSRTRVVAQRPTLARGVADPRADVPATRAALDGWLVTRYRDAQLLEDSASLTQIIAPNASHPRVESTREAATGDTLFAVHFSVHAAAQRATPALRVGSVVRLSEPSGALSSQSARVLARRPFRAPARPGAALRPGARSDDTGRYGWSYLLVATRVTRRTGTTPLAGAWRGWLLVEQPDTLPRNTSRRDAVRRGDSVRTDTLPP